MTIKDRVRTCEVCKGTFKSVRPKVTVHGSGRQCMYIHRGAKIAGITIDQYMAKKGIVRPAPVYDVPPTLQEAAVAAGIVQEVPAPLPQFPKPEPQKPVDVTKLLLLSGLDELREELAGSDEIPFPEAGQSAPVPEPPKRSVRSRTHLIIPDCQVKEGVPIEHLEWIGKYIALKRPDVIICIGDFGDMPSLSLYDKGKKVFEGRTYAGDIQAVRRAMKLLVDQFRNIPGYNPRMIMLLGNHEYRIIRACEIDRELSGTLKIEHLGYEQFGWTVYPFLDIVKVDGIEYCLEENHKVLTEDLRWVALKDVKVGDRLVGFEEESAGQTASGKKLARRYKTAIVEQHDPDTAGLYEVVLTDGTRIRATAEHRWLARTPAGLEWRTTLELAGLQYALPRVMNTWMTEESREAGWLAGIFDGEGWLSKPNSNQGGVQIGIGQNEGGVLDRIRTGLTTFGISTFEENGSRCKSVRLGGPSGEKLSFLGRVRPERLISKFKSSMLGRVQAMNGDVGVVSVTPVGAGTIIKIKTSTGTMIAEGFPQHNCHYFTSGVMGRPVSSAAVLLRERQGSAIMGHNQVTDMAIHKKTQRIAMMVGTCYLHDEPYLTPQGNDQRRQIVMLHEVDGDGHFDPMFVSLDYLSRRFGDGRQIYRGVPHEDRLPAVYTDDYEGRTPYGSQD